MSHPDPTLRATALAIAAITLLWLGITWLSWPLLAAAVTGGTWAAVKFIQAADPPVEPELLAPAADDLDRILRDFGLNPDEGP